MIKKFVALTLAVIWSTVAHRLLGSPPIVVRSWVISGIIIIAAVLLNEILARE